MKNYNIFALRGDTETSDYEVCDSLGINPRLAGTPAINDAAISKMQRENYQGYLKQGVPESVARSRSNKAADALRHEIKTLLA